MDPCPATPAGERSAFGPSQGSRMAGERGGDCRPRPACSLPVAPVRDAPGRGSCAALPGVSRSTAAGRLSLSGGGPAPVGGPYVLPARRPGDLGLIKVRAAVLVEQNPPRNMWRTPKTPRNAPLRRGFEVARHGRHTPRSRRFSRLGMVRRRISWVWSPSRDKNRDLNVIPPVLPGFLPFRIGSPQETEV